MNTAFLGHCSRHFTALRQLPEALPCFASSDSRVWFPWTSPRPEPKDPALAARTLCLECRDAALGGREAGTTSRDDTDMYLATLLWLMASRRPEPRAFPSVLSRALHDLSGGSENVRFRYGLFVQGRKASSGLLFASAATSPSRVSKCLEQVMAALGTACSRHGSLLASFPGCSRESLATSLAPLFSFARVLNSELGCGSLLAFRTPTSGPSSSAASGRLPPAFPTTPPPPPPGHVLTSLVPSSQDLSASRSPDPTPPPPPPPPPSPQISLPQPRPASSGRRRRRCRLEKKEVGLKSMAAGTLLRQRPP